MDFVLLVKLAGVSYKLSFPKRPTVAEVAKEVAKQANLSSDTEVVLQAADKDFPNETVVLSATAELSNKQVLHADTRTKEVHTWEAVDCPERGKAVLREHGITPETAGCLVQVLGFSEPDDLCHVTPALLDKLPLKPLEKLRFQKLVEDAQRGSVPGISLNLRAPSARFVKKTGLDAAAASTTAGAPAAKPAAASSKPAPAAKSTLDVDRGARHIAGSPTSGSKPSVAAPAKKATSTSGAAKPATGGSKVPCGKSSALGSRNASNGGTEAASGATSKKPADEDEDEDEMLKRILAEGETEKHAASAEFQSHFENPLVKAEHVATLEGHTESVLAIALSPDESTLFTASGDSTIKVWNVAAFILQQTLMEHSASVGVLCMSAGGDLLFSASGDGCVIAWCVLGGKANLQFRKDEAHDYGILAMTLSNSGVLLFTASADKKIRGWEVDLNENCLTLAMEMSGHLEPVRCMALSPDDTFLFSGSEDATIKMWQADPQDGYKFIRALRGHEAAVYGLAMSRDGSMLVSCSADKTITVWKLASGSGKRGAGKGLLPDGPAIKQVLTGHTGDINCVVLSTDAKTIYTSGDDKTIRVWSLLAPKGDGKHKEDIYALQHTLEGHALIVYRLAVSSKGDRVYSGSADNSAKVWSIARQV